MQHTNDPDHIGPGKSYIYVYRVTKTIKSCFLYFTISSCFSIWWKNILCNVTTYLRFKKKERQNTTENPLRKLWWMNLQQFQQKDTFKHYSYPKEILHYICALVPNNMKYEILEDSHKVFLKKFCEALQTNLLQCFSGSRFWKIYWKGFGQKFLF